MFIDVLIFSLIYLFIDVLIKTTTEKDHGDQRKLNLKPRRQSPFSVAIIRRLRTPKALQASWASLTSRSGRIAQNVDFPTGQLFNKRIIKHDQRHCTGKIWEIIKESSSLRPSSSLAECSPAILPSSHVWQPPDIAAAKSSNTSALDSWWAKHSSCTTSVSDTGAV